MTPTLKSNLLRCDRCGAQLYAKVNRVKAGDTCDRSIIAEYDDGQVYRQCPGILRRSRS